MHTRILAAPGQIDFSVIPESLDLCPGCNWDEAWLSRPWMWLNAPFILLLFWVLFFLFFYTFYHAVLGLYHTLSACPVPLPLLDFPSASASSHKQAFFWLDVWITQPHLLFHPSALASLMLLLPPSLSFELLPFECFDLKNCSEGRWWKQKGLMGNWQTQG